MNHQGVLPSWAAPTICALCPDVVINVGYKRAREGLYLLTYTPHKWLDYLGGKNGIDSFITPKYLTLKWEQLEQAYKNISNLKLFFNRCNIMGLYRRKLEFINKIFFSFFTLLWLFLYFFKNVSNVKYFEINFNYNYFKN